MGGLGGRDYALGPGEAQAGLEALPLGDGHRLHQAQLVDVGQQRRHPVVAQSAGVDGLGDERVAQGVHLQQRRHLGRVAEVVAVLALGERRARGRLDAAHGRAHAAGHLLPQEREGQAREVRPAAGAAHQHVGPLVHHGHLQERLLADDGLVHQDVVQDAAQAVAGGRVGGRHHDGLGYGHPQRPGVAGVGGQQAPPVLGGLRRAGVDRGPPHLHHRLAVGLLAVRGRHLPHLAVDAVLGAGEGQGAPPLAGPGLGGQPGDALGVVVEGLGHRGVGLVGASRAHPLVLVEDLGRGVEGALEPAGPHQRAGPPQPQHVEDPAGDVHVALRGHLLGDEGHREQGGQIVGPGRFQGARMQGRGRGRGQVGDDVVPLRRLLRRGQMHPVVVVGHGWRASSGHSGGSRRPRSGLIVRPVRHGAKGRRGAEPPSRPAVRRPQPPPKLGSRFSTKAVRASSESPVR